jgi:hypothetical protein
MHNNVAAPRRPREIVEIGPRRSCDCDDTDGARAVEATLMMDGCMYGNAHVAGVSSV